MTQNWRFWRTRRPIPSIFVAPMRFESRMFRIIGRLKQLLR
nr:MAG TPA: hypothetical protein [Caudoviricetes sp.]